MKYKTNLDLKQKYKISLFFQCKFQFQFNNKRKGISATNLYSEPGDKNAQPGLNAIFYQSFRNKIPNGCVIKFYYSSVHNVFLF